MKLSDSFDARRLRPRRPRVWRWRLAAAFAALVASLGVLLSLAGTSALIGRQPAVGMLHIEPPPAAYCWPLACCRSASACSSGVSAAVAAAATAT